MSEQQQGASGIVTLFVEAPGAHLHYNMLRVMEHCARGAHCLRTVCAEAAQLAAMCSAAVSEQLSCATHCAQCIDPAAERGADGVRSGRGRAAAARGWEGRARGARSRGPVHQIKMQSKRARETPASHLLLAWLAVEVMECGLRGQGSRLG